MGGEHFRWLLAVLQSVASVAVLGLWARLLAQVTTSPRLRSGLLVMAAVSGFLLFDMAVLSDSFYADLFLITLLSITSRLLGGSRCDIGATGVLGGIWGLSLMLRDVGLFHTVLPMAGLLLAAWRWRLGWLRSVAHLVAFLLPVLVVVSGTMAWNHHRTGHTFFSITGGINWLWPSMNIVDRHLGDPFDCADPVCVMARSLPLDNGMHGVAQIAGGLWERDHLDPAQFGQVTLSHFLGMVRAHPGPFLVSWLGNLQYSHLADLAFNPLANINELFRLHTLTGDRVVPALRELTYGVRHGRVWLVFPLVISGGLSVGALLALTVVLIYTPWRALLSLRRGWENPEGAVTALFLWVVATSFISSYSLVHMEMRHALPVAPLILLAFAWTVESYQRRSAAVE